MKSKSFFVTAFTVVVFTVKLMAQPVTCSDFSITGISPDSLNSNGYNISILFSADSATFINYPYVSAVLDCNGDTVATGTMNFFGQFGQSTFDYPVTVNGSFTCQPLTAVFIYGNESFTNDTCLLTFGANSGFFNSPETEKVFSVFPNPAKSQVTIQNDVNLIGTRYVVYDYSGKLILTGKILSENTTLDISNLRDGLYLFQMGNNLEHTCKVIKQ
ncbi:MAG: T9SS type A sorting domain-containing protein [Flavobacteriales bacterium]|nr:T9SS type A sorting domain-containing protein [Flavobacteriales bacterium]